jgi:hypothetical protein
MARMSICFSEVPSYAREPYNKNKLQLGFALQRNDGFLRE